MCDLTRESFSGQPVYLRQNFCINCCCKIQVIISLFPLKIHGPVTQKATDGRSLPYFYTCIEYFFPRINE